MTAFDLVFHCPYSTRKEPSDAFASAVRKVLDATSGVVRLVSPYLGAQVLAPVVAGREFRLITDLDACFERGPAPDVRMLLAANLAHVRDLPGVHAKVVLGDEAALLGSANLTKQGFCDRFELGILVCEPRSLRQMDVWFEQLFALGTPVDLAKLDAAIERGRHLASSFPATSAAGRGRAGGSLGWMGTSSVLSQPPSDDPEEAEEMDALAAQLTKLAMTRGEADLVLDMLAEALRVADLPPDDRRLHLSFGRARIQITIVQRYVAWCGRQKDRSVFGFILDDNACAARAVTELPGAWAGSFRGRDGIAGPPTVKVPLAELGRVPEFMLDSWRRAIRREVERKTREGRAPASSYLAHKQPRLYDVLKNEAIRGRLQMLAFPRRCWWFGVNNNSRGYVQLHSLRPFLDGSEQQFTWPVSQGKPGSRFYREITGGDRVLLWTGHDKSKRSEPRWGVLGAATVVAVDADRIVLGSAQRFPNPITPYPRGGPRRTPEFDFLSDALGPSFAPLGDVRYSVLNEPRTSPVTVCPVPTDAFDSIVAFGASLTRFA